MDVADETVVLDEFRARCDELVEPLREAARASAAFNVQVYTLLAALTAPSPHPILIAAMTNVAAEQMRAISDAMGKVALIWLSRDGGQA